MAKFVNSFSLLDDEEDDDIEVLVDRIVKKVDTPLMHAQNQKEALDFVQNENGGRTGGQGLRNGSHGDGYGGNDNVDGGYDQDVHRRNYDRYSYGCGDVIEDDGHQRGNGRGCGRGQGHGRGYSGEFRLHKVNEGNGDDKYDTQYDDAGWQDVSKSHGKGFAGHGRSFGRGFSGHFEQRTVNEATGVGNNDTRYDDAGWKDASKSHGKGYANRGHTFGDGQERFRTGNWSSGGERSGNCNQVQCNDAADGQGRYRNGNRKYGGQRRGYGDQFQDDAAEGLWRYRNGSRSFGSERRGYLDQVQANDAGFEQLNGEGDISEDAEFRGEEKMYRIGNQNNGYEKRSYGGYKGRGIYEYQKRTDSDELKETGNADERRTLNVGHVNGSGSDPKQGTKEEKKIDESELKRRQVEEPKQKKKEEEDEEAMLMTLDQYEKLLLEKRQALESLNTEERRVVIDKEFEGMRLVEKRPDDSDDKCMKKHMKGKLKMKNSLKKQASESPKTVDNKISEEEKLKPKESLETKEKGRKYVTVEVQELFKPAFRRRSSGGREQGRNGRGRGDRGGFSARANYDASRTNDDASVRAIAPASARALLPIPTDTDFPVLGAAAPAPVKA